MIEITDTVPVIVPRKTFIELLEACAKKLERRAADLQAASIQHSPTMAAECQLQADAHRFVIEHLAPGEQVAMTSRYALTLLRGARGADVDLMGEKVDARRQ